MFHVIITRPAENDLQQIVDYISIELQEPNTAQHLITKIAGAVIKLEQMPLRYPLVADKGLAHRGIRRMSVENYNVFYVVSEQRKTVTVIRILYGKRNWKHLL